MPVTNASLITIADAMDTMKDVDDCIKEIDSIIQRSAIMDRQLVAQENYINLSKLNTSYRINLYKHRHTETVKWDNGLGVRRIERNLLMISSNRNHSLVLNNDGRVYSFGSNANGQLGRTATDMASMSTPTEIDTSNIKSDNDGNEAPIIAISAGGDHSLVLAENGKVYSFGSNYYGQLGRSTTIDDYSARRNLEQKPTKINDLINIKAISSGGLHSMVLDEGGKVYSFGWNEYGQLGRTATDTESRSTPTEINMEANTKITAISAGLHHSLVLEKDGRVFSFGHNKYTQLGHGGTSITNVTTPTLIDTSNIAPNKIFAISSGGQHSMVLDEGGRVYSFGSNGHGQLGRTATDTESRSTPTEINISNIIGLSAGNEHSLIFKNDRIIYSFGRNEEGQLGHGGISTADVTTPTKISAISRTSIFNTLQLLPPVDFNDTNDTERVVLTGVNKDLEVFNGVDIMGTKQFLIGVNAILTHPNNITETLPPNIVVVSPKPKEGESINATQDGISELGWYWSSYYDIDGHVNQWCPWLRPNRSDRDNKDCWSPFPYHGAWPGWLMLDLGRVRTVIGLVLQGRENSNQYVKTLKVKISTDKLFYEFVDNAGSDVFQVEYTPWDGDPTYGTLTGIPVPVMFPNPVIARYVKIYVIKWKTFPAMRVGVMVQDKPYHPGMKQGLTTSILKGLLMQGNKNIPPDDSTKAIKEVIPDNGMDVTNGTILNVETDGPSPSTGRQSIKTNKKNPFPTPTLVTLTLEGSHKVTSINGETSPSGNSYIALTWESDTNSVFYMLFSISETPPFASAKALKIITTAKIPEGTIIASPAPFKQIRGFGLQ